MSRTRKTTWNYLTSLAHAGVTMAVGLVATPLLLRYLGEERFGAFRAASDWMGHLSVVGIGLSGALLPLFSRSISQKNVPAVRAAIRAGFRGYLRATVIAIVLGGLLLAILPWLVVVSGHVTSDLRWGFAIGLVGCLLLPLGTFRSLAEANQRSSVVNSWVIVQFLVTTSLAVLLAWSGFGIVGQFVALIIGSACFHLGVLVDGLRQFPASPDEQTDADVADDMKNAVRKLHGPTLINGLVGRMNLYADNAVIACLLGSRTVAAFFLTQRLIVLIQGQICAVGGSSWASLLDLHGRGERGRFNDQLVRLTTMVVVLGVAAMAPLVAFNRTFISLWVGPQQYAGDTVTTLATLNAVLLAVISLWGLVVAGAGCVADMVPINLLAAAINVPVSIVFTFMLGISGPLWGTLLAFVGAYSWSVPRLLNRRFGTSIPEIARAVLLPFIVGAPYTIMISLWARTNQPRGWFDLILSMATASVAYVLVAWCTIFTRTERAFWIERSRHLISWGRTL